MHLSSLARTILFWLSCHSRPTSVSSLKILLTNDDGRASPGLQTLKVALRDDGHNVTVYAPNMQRSGSGAALTISNVKATQVDLQEYEIDGTPATCVLVGLVAEEASGPSPPDLIISGTNPGNNGGPGIIHSGTVGAALTGLSRKIVSMAVATNPPNPQDEADTLRHFQDVAQFMTLLVDAVEDMITEFPEKVGLKIGYPTVTTASDVLGARIAANGDSSLFTGGYAEVENPDPPIGEGERLFTVAFGPSFEELDPESDVALVEEGYVSILALENDLAFSARSKKKKKMIKERKRATKRFERALGIAVDAIKFP